MVELKERGAGHGIIAGMPLCLKAWKEGLKWNS
jgi:hypothetical protein